MKRCYRFAGCFTSLFVLVGLVFYIIAMVNRFVDGVNWVEGFFLIYGLAGIVIIGPMISNQFFLQSIYIETFEDKFMNSCKVEKCRVEKTTNIQK